MMTEGRSRHASVLTEFILQTHTKTRTQKKKEKTKKKSKKIHHSHAKTVRTILFDKIGPNNFISLQKDVNSLQFIVSS